MRRLTFSLVLVAFVFSCGGQWYALQCIAWTNMIREYSEMVPFTQAVQMTFSGQYPCELCKTIAEKKQSQNLKLATLEKQKKQRLAPEFTFALPVADASPHTFVVRDQPFQTRSEVPPTPPPRFA